MGRSLTHLSGQEVRNLANDALRDYALVKLVMLRQSHGQGMHSTRQIAGLRDSLGLKHTKTLFKDMFSDHVKEYTEEEISSKRKEITLEVQKMIKAWTRIYRNAEKIADKWNRGEKWR